MGLQAASSARAMLVPLVYRRMLSLQSLPSVSRRKAAADTHALNSVPISRDYHGQVKHEREERTLSAWLVLEAFRFCSDCPHPSLLRPSPPLRPPQRRPPPWTIHLAHR